MAREPLPTRSASATRAVRLMAAARGEARFKVEVALQVR
jgi:hypothetical protein